MAFIANRMRTPASCMHDGWIGSINTAPKKECDVQKISVMKATKSSFICVAFSLCFIAAVYGEGQSAVWATPNIDRVELASHEEDIRFSGLSKEQVQNQHRKPWSVRDSVALRYVVTWQSAANLNLVPAINPIVVSSSRRYFFFVTRRGDLDRDCNLYTLSVYSTDALEAALSNKINSSMPRAYRKVSLCSSTDDPAIGGAKWLNGSAEIVFLGTNLGGQRRVFKFNVLSGKLTQLTPPDKNVVRYGLAANQIYFWSSKLSEPLPNYIESYPSHVVEKDDFARLLVPQKQIIQEFNFGYQGRGYQTVLHNVNWGYNRGPWVSPDGRHAFVTSTPSDELPFDPRWSEYKAPDDSQKIRLREAPSFVYVKSDGSTPRRVPDAPIGMFVEAGALKRMVHAGKVKIRYLRPQVLWSSDSKHAILINAALPFSEDMHEARSMSYIVDFDVNTGKYNVIEPIDTKNGGVGSVGWLTVGRDLLITHLSADNQQLPGTLYTLRDGEWTGRPVSSDLKPIPLEPTPEEATYDSLWQVELNKSLVLRMLQGPNDPPRIIASNGMRDIDLLEPDPVLSNVWRATATTITWPEPHNKSGSGLLMLPKSLGNEPLPLVIQADVAWDAFLPDGAQPNGFAAQPLVAEGIAVLQLSIATAEEGLGTSSEGTFFVERLDAAVSYLSRAGIIDPNRVGLIGFSRTGYNVYQAITHPGITKVKASIVVDSKTDGYAVYLIKRSIDPEFGATNHETRMMMGGRFWQNKSGWLVHSPGFNIDRVQGAALFTYHGMQNQVHSFEIFGAFKEAGKPIELMFFPHGGHPLVKVRERLASLTTTVDWMNFWLNDAEENDSARKEQYARWRKMRNAIRARDK